MEPIQSARDSADVAEPIHRKMPMIKKAKPHAQLMRYPRKALQPRHPDRHVSVLSLSQKEKKRMEKKKKDESREKRKGKGRTGRSMEKHGLN